MVRVSYLLTVYNKAAYLPAVLEAVRTQKGAFAREIVIVDDGSTDDSVAVAKAVTANWPDVSIIVQANAGASAAMNRAAEAARGEYLKLVDADDLLFPSATAVLLDALEKTGAVLAVGQARPYDFRAIPKITEDDAATGRHALMADALAATLHTSRYNPSTMLLRRTDYVRAGGCDPRVTCQEYSLSLPLALLGRFVEIANTVALVATGDSSRLSASQGRELFNITRATLHFLQAHPEIPARYKRIALQKAAGRAKSWARRRGAPDGALPYWWEFALSFLPLPLDHARHMERCLAAFDQPAGRGTI